MCLTSHAISQLLELLFDMRDTKRPRYPSGTTKTHLGVVEQHFTDTIMNASFTIMFQTDLYLPSANRYLTYLIHRNETV